MQKDTSNNLVKKRNTTILIGALIFLSFIFGWSFGHLDFQRQNVGYSPITQNRTNQANFDLFWQVWDKVTQNFDGPIDYQKLIYGAIDGMVKATGDPYTTFFTPDQTQNFNNELEGNISGIGAEVGIKNGKITVVAPIDNSPAQKAGVKAQDIILKIDDADTQGMDLNTAVSKIRGQAGTKVKLVIQRGEEQLNFEITRENIEVKSVKWEVKSDNIGYIEISKFDSNTSTLIKNATNDLSQKGVKGIILDLRNNPGGYLDAAVNVSSEFIKSGKVVIEKTDTTSKKQDYFASGQGRMTDTNVPMIVLVNGGSASASEIVSGALQDSKRATLLGEKTFGKGSVQSVEEMAKGSSLHLTIAHWYTPNGRSINKEGLAPDIEVKMTDDDINNSRDPQLDRALAELKARIN
jgi:carboxyl-terminal processing protease